MPAIVIRSTRVVLPDGIRPAEIAVKGGRIEAIRPYEPGSPDPRSPTPDLRDVGDCVVMPGIIDTHVHVNEPGRTEWEGFETAAAAAAAGGITTIVDMPLNSVPATTRLWALDAKQYAARDASIEVLFWGGLVPGNADDLEGLAGAGVRGFKCFLAPSGVEEFEFVEEPDLREALPILKRLGCPLLAHAEWPPALKPVPASSDPRVYATWLASRPPQAEVEAIQVLIDLSREFRAAVHIVHLAAAEALPLIRAARAEGLPITVETCPHYLTFCAEEISDGATLFKCAPPIRGRANREALWQALVDGDIDLIATDHSPCPPSLKADDDFVRAWGGIAALELSLPAVWTAASARGVPLERLAHWLSAAPARLASIDGRKGSIAVGKEADLVVWDPDATFVVDESRLHQRHKRTPYAGLTLRGRVIETYARGRLVYGDSEDR
jgi:allantoinase